MKMSTINNFLNWSFRCGSLFGIPISLHISLIFFIYPIVRFAPSIGFLYAIELIVGLVVSILLHELGHALAAKRYKLEGLSIMLHGFGGFAVSRGYRNPKQQIVIVLAGPAVTFILAAIGYSFGAFRLSQGLGSELQVQLAIAYMLGLANLMMGVLNMMPLLPFDGGQAAAAALSFKMPEVKATRLVAHVGLIFAPILILAGLTVLSGLVAIFGLISMITCYQYLVNTGGIRFKEFFDDRKAVKAVRAVKKRENERKTIYIDDVVARQVKRDQKEKLRKLLDD